MDIISIPLGWVMKFIYDFVGNYGFSLILFTLFTKVILLPLTIRQKKSTMRMSVFQPYINDINKKYANDSQKRMEEMQKLQQEYGFSMTAGCLPLLIQMPILFGLIDVIYSPLKHIVGLSEEVIAKLVQIATETGVLSGATSGQESIIIGAIQENAAPYADLLDASSLLAIQNLDLMFFGINLTAIPTLAFNILLIVPVLSVGSMLLSQIVTMKLAGQKLEGPTKNMLFITPVMFLYFSFTVPVGVSLYWIFSSLFTLMFELLIRLFLNFDKEKAKIEEEIKLKKEELKKQKKNQAPRGAVTKAIKAQKEAEALEYAIPEEEQGEVDARLKRARELDREKYGE